VNRLEKLIQTVQSYQELHNLNDGELAELLGIDRSSWSYIRDKKHKPGNKFFDGLGKIPELRMAVYEYFSAGEPVSVKE
jgi:hypothetical protein